MGQPVLTATLALAIAVVLTSATAIATLAAKTPSRAVKLIGVVAVIAFAVVALQRANLRINFTDSMPMGIYYLSPLPLDGVKRGMLVAACAPNRAAETGHARGYLAPGPCADGTELLLKSVVALAGDEVAVTLAGVTVNDCLLPDSRAEAHDRSGRRLDPWRRSDYRLPAARFWLYAPNNWSWDSRYWGPVSLDAIVSEAVPLFVFPSLRVIDESSWTASHDMPRDPP